MQLNDLTLFRQQAFINGEWRDALSSDVITVTNPANGEVLGSVPKNGRRRDARCDPGRPSRPSRLATANGKRARRDPAPLVRSDDGQTRTIWPG